MEQFIKIIWTRLGGFDEKIKYQDDYDFWLKIKKLNNIKIGYLPEQGYNYRKHNKNMSKSIFKKNLTKFFVFLREEFYEFVNHRKFRLYWYKFN